MIIHRWRVFRSKYLSSLSLISDCQHPQFCNPLTQFLIYDDILLLLHSNFNVVMKWNANISYAGYLICDPQWGQDPQIEICWVRAERREGLPVFQLLVREGKWWWEKGKDKRASGDFCMPPIYQVEYSRWCTVFTDKSSGAIGQMDNTLSWRPWALSQLEPA